MRHRIAIVALGSGAAGFILAALTLTHSPPPVSSPSAADSAEEKPLPSLIAPAAPRPSPAVLAEIAAAMSAAPTLETAQAWAQRDPGAFLWWLRHAQPVPPADVTEAFFREWKKGDARAAFLAACEMPDCFGLRGSKLLSIDFPHLFAFQPTTALELLPVIEGRYCPSIAPGWVMGNPAESLCEPLNPADISAQLNRVPASESGREFARCFANFLNQKSSDTALAWTATLPAAMATAAYTEIVGALVATQPQAALEIMGHLPPEQVQALRSTENFMLELAGRAPAETIAWLSDYTGLVPQETAQLILSSWMRKDLPAATEWILTAGNPAGREALVAGAGRHIGSDDALKWAENLPADLRESALTGIVTDRNQMGISSFLNYLTPPANGTLTPSQLHVLNALGTRVKDLGEPEYAQLLQWARSPANVTAKSFER